MSGLRQALLEGRLRWLGRPAHRSLIAVELAGQHLLDLPGTAARQRRAALVADRLTIVVKTFERPHLLRRLVRSVHRTHPGVRVVVVDDSATPTELDGVDTVVLPFDQGVSAGKAAGLATVSTEFVAFLDDDFVLDRHTGLAGAVAVLEDEPAIDLVGGRVVDLPSFRSVDYRTSGLFPTAVPPKVPPGTTFAGLPVYDKVANFYVARAEGLRQVGWDPNLKRTDHTDWFTRARGVLTTVYDEDLRCLHAQDRFATAYLAHRVDDTADRQVIAERWFSG
jgi:hypothetical protein